MNYTAQTAYTTEKRDSRAIIYSLISYTVLIMILLFVKWSMPASPVPPFEDGIEVNLGNSEFGSGDVQPMIPGEPSASDETSYTPPKTTTSNLTNVKDIDTDDSDPDAPEINKPVNTNKSNTVSDKPVSNKKSKPNNTTVANPTPTPPTPKAVYKGGTGTGTGGNNADSYSKSNNQGVAGGNGDQGKPNGNPDSDSYTGNGGSGNSGVTIQGLTGRKFRSLPSFEDEFNESAKVAVDVKVDKAGNVIQATYQPRGSTTADAKMKEIAIQKAKQIKFNAVTSGDAEQFGTLIFNFKLKV
ncbi:MAG TPA: hypothetical protein VIK74_11335 [Parasegetibacter sp.]